MPSSRRWRRTPRKLRNLLTAADNGDLAQGLALFEEMEQKDATLSSVANVRRMALTGLDYEIVSAADTQDAGADRTLADDAADYIRDQLADVERFEEGLEHLATAIGSNLAVLELTWNDIRLEDVEAVPSWRLIMDAHEPGQVNVITADSPLGDAALSPKFVVHEPYSSSGFPFTRSIMRAQAFVYLIKQLAVSDWAVFCEIFGMPVRIAKYEQTATREEKEELVKMMQTLGTRAFGVFSRAVEIEFKESSQRGTAPFESLINWCDRTQAKIWLGGHLTSDTTGGDGDAGGGGSTQRSAPEPVRRRHQARRAHGPASDHGSDVCL